MSRLSLCNGFPCQGGIEGDKEHEITREKALQLFSRVKKSNMVKHRGSQWQESLEVPKQTKKITHGRKISIRQSTHERNSHLKQSWQHNPSITPEELTPEQIQDKAELQDIIHAL